MTKEFSTSYLKDYKEPNMNFDIIAWVNAPKIDATISLDGYTAIDTAQNTELADHESRIDALESA